MPARFFILTSGDTVGKFIDRAAAHGAPGRAVAQRRPHPGPGVYGVVELHPPKAMCGGEHDWVSRPHAVVCSVCDETMPGSRPAVAVKKKAERAAGGGS